jgi:hypothetical protein
MQAQITAAFPSLATFGIPIADNVLSALQAGQHCDGALAPEPEIKALWSDGNLCNFEIIGMPVVSMFTGFYTADWLAENVAYAAASLKQAGVWDTIERNHLHPRSACARDAVQASNRFVQLTPEHMMGNCMILGFCAILGVIIMLTRDRSHLKRRSKAVIDEVEDCAVKTGQSFKHGVERAEHSFKGSVPGGHATNGARLKTSASVDLDEQSDTDGDGDLDVQIVRAELPNGSPDSEEPLSRALEI